MARTSDVKRLAELWHDLSGFKLWAKACGVMAGYVGLLGADEVEEAVFVAAERDDSIIDRWRYFCGICRCKLGQQLEGKPIPTEGEHRT